MLDKVLGKKLLYLILPQIPFPASGQRSQLTGCLLSVGCALWLVMGVCQPLSSAMLQHRTILFIATSPIENSSSLQRTSAIHPAWRYTYLKLIPDCFAASFPSSAVPFLTCSCTQAVSQGLSAGFHHSWVVLLQIRFGLDAGEL